MEEPLHSASARLIYESNTESVAESILGEKARSTSEKSILIIITVQLQDKSVKWISKQKDETVTQIFL